MYHLLQVLNATSEVLQKQIEQGNEPTEAHMSLVNALDTFLTGLDVLKEGISKLRESI